MGVNDRDYGRDPDAANRWKLDYGGSSGRRSRGGGGGGWSPSGSQWPPICKWLIIINIAIFVLQILIPPVTDWLSLDAAKVLKGQIWRVMTCAFCHDPDGVIHLLFNMLFLGWFGRPLEQKYGSKEFLGIYISAALLASFLFMALNLYLGRNNPMIGASGAIMAIVIIYAMFNPRQKVLIWFVIPVEIRWIVLFFVIYDLFPVLQMLGGKSIQTGTAHAAHLGGLAFGFLYVKRNWRLEPIMDKIYKPKTKTERVYQAKQKVQQKEDKSEHRIDAILEKINRDGIGSLTEKERKLLTGASRDLRDKP
ncbi:MAG: membrane associated rhomboid family serine protease [Kiritimatiellia bacterium]|jgi:membrane associated rhomboid family serine protease